MKLLKEYFELQKKIYDYFGYQEDWVKIPLDDSTDVFWSIRGSEENGDIVFAAQKEQLPTEEHDDGNYYNNDIYTQRFLPKWVYRGEEYTMICVDTNTDGNKFLQVFDNNKEIKDL